MPGALTGLIGAGGGGVIGGAVVRLTLDSSQFNAGLASAQGKLQSIGAGMSRLGGTLTRGVTVPLVAAGAVATKMALDFNKAFVQIQTLASKGGMSIEQMKTQVLSLAKATGQDPSGLANALYNVLSAGKAAASQAFPILTSAAKAAAIGMGNVQDIAKVLVSTMNAYGPKTISAAQATDVLAQATKDSAANAQDLAASIGPVIGVAAQVGVSFQDVAAAIATATNQGISADRAATGLRYLLTSLKAPTDAAKTALDRYGVSVQDLQRMLANQGLQGTLQSLAKTFDLTTTRGQEAWKAVVGGARGAIVANTQVGKSAAAAAQEVDNLNNSQGRLTKSFQIWGQTITGKNAKALSDLKVAAIQLGEKLIPIFEKVVGAVTSLVNAFSKLPSSVQGTIVKVAALAALAGPLLKIGGIVTGLVGKFAQLTGAAGDTGTAVADIAGVGGADGLAAVVPQIAGVAFAIKGLVSEFGAFKSGGIVAGAASAIKTMDQALGVWNKELDSTTTAGNRFDAGMTRTGHAVTAAANSVLQSSGAFKAFSAANKQADTNALALNHTLPTTMNQMGGLQHQTEATQGVMSGAAKVAGTLTGAIMHIPTSHKTNVTVNTGNALGQIGAVIGAIGNIPRSVPVTVSVNTVNTGTGRVQKGPSTGAIIPGAASGGITRASTYMQVGEGSYSTFVGKGSEAVIPLNDRGIGILAKAMQKAGGRSGSAINVTINTQGSMDPNALAASVSRHLSRTIREEALV